MNVQTIELRRRTVIKALVWRIIGIVWTWVGAYFIILLLPDQYKSATIIATLIVAYHHSTRMVMYYLYERMWVSFSWGREEAARPMSLFSRVFWIAGTIVTISLIFYLLIFVTPKIKADQKRQLKMVQSVENIQQTKEGKL